MKRHLAYFLVPLMLISIVSQAQDFLYTRENPIPINLSSGSFQNTHPVPGNTGYIRYKFTLPVQRTVSLSSCGSDFFTTVYVLNPSGAVLGISNGYGELCPALQGSLVLTLPPGDYYYVAAGHDFPAVYTGTLVTSITCDPFQDQSGVEVSTDFSDQMGKVFANLETSRVPYGLLRDIAFEQTNLQAYDGSLIADSNRASIGDFKAIYQTLVSAQIDPSAGNFTTMDHLDTLAMAQRQPGIVVLHSLYYQYSKFTDDAAAAGRVSVVNNQVIDNYVGGDWQNPYEVKTAFAVSPAGDQVEGKTQQFVLPSSLLVSNSLEQVASIQFNAGDGAGFRTITTDVPVSVNYSDAGVKELTFQFLLSDNSTLTAHSSITVSPSISDLNPEYGLLNITSSETYNGLSAQGYATIKYGRSDRILRKPLIVVEGFDPGIVITPEKKYGYTDITKFIDPTATDGFNSLINNGTYDVVFIDYKNGLDDIKRNALLFEEVVRQVNQLKAQSGSTEPNVVLGLSMGGLVARWGLRDMENKGQNHQTRLYISFDSPHQGANVPLGYQYMANHLYGLYAKTAGPLIGNLYNVGRLNQIPAELRLASFPAARQMLINYVDPSGNIDNSAHYTWQNELKTMGYPQGLPGQPIRNVAVSNGTACGTGQVSSPGSSLLTVNGRFSTSVLGEIASLGLLSVAIPIAGVGLGQPGLLLGLLPGKNRIDFDVALNTTAATGGNQVYHNKITYTKTILFLIPVRVNLTNRTNNAPGGILPYDSYAGGSFHSTFDVSNVDIKKWLFTYTLNVTQQPEFGFIPRTSALDIGLGNVTLTDDDYKARYVGSSPLTAPKTSPFVNFTTGSTTLSKNESHTSILSATGNWLGAELNGLNPRQEDVTPLCYPTSISGPAALCSSAPLTFSVNVLPGRSVNWAVSPDLDIVSGQNTAVITVKPNGTNNTDGSQSFVDETVITSLGNQNSRFTLTRPGFLGIDYQTSGPCSGSAQLWTLNAKANIANATNWLWTVDNPNPLSQFYIYSQGSPQTFINVTGGGGVSVSYTDPCGYIHKSGVTLYSNCRSSAASIYPNPASSVLNVGFGTSNNLTVKTALFQETSIAASLPNRVELYAANSTVPIRTETKAEILSGGNKAVFNVEGLDSGIYFLHIVYSDHTEQATAQIK